MNREVKLLCKFIFFFFLVGGGLGWGGQGVCKLRSEAFVKIQKKNWGGGGGVGLGGSGWM